jgi:hypothetical protein
VFGDVAFAQAPFAALGGKTLASSLSESAVADSFVSQESRAGARVDETATASTVFASLNNIMVAAQAETAIAIATTNFAASTLTATQTETATATDTPAAAPSTFNASLFESVTASDAQVAISNVLAAIAEIATGADSSNRGILVTATITETATGTAVATATASVNATVAELAAGLDSYSKIKEANVYPSGIQLTVHVGQVLVWGTIPTDQTPPAPDWTDIPT